MVWAGICASGKTPLVFVNPGVKINKITTYEKLLMGNLGPGDISGIENRFFSRTLTQPTRLEMFRPGAGPIFLISSLGLPTTQILSFSSSYGLPTTQI